MSGDQVKAFLLGASKPATVEPTSAAPQEPTTLQEPPLEAPALEPETVSEEVDTQAQEAADNDALSQLRNLDPKIRDIVERLVKESRARDQESINKRIGKEVAKTKSLEARLAELESAPPKEKEVPVPVALPTPDSPLANINDMATLQQEFKKAREVYHIVDEVLITGPNEMGVYAVDGKEYSREQLVQIRRNAAKMADDYIPQRAQFLEAKQKFAGMARQQFPWMTQPESPEYKLMQEQRQSAPWLLTLPNADMLLGVFVEGLKAVQGKSTPNVAPTVLPTRRPPSDQVATSQQASGGNRVNNISIQREAVRGSLDKLSKAGGVSGRDVAQYLQKLDLTRNQ